MAQQAQVMLLQPSCMLPMSLLLPIKLDKSERFYSSFPQEREGGVFWKGEAIQNAPHR
jgi:hypothetical protein